MSESRRMSKLLNTRNRLAKTNHYQADAFSGKQNHTRGQSVSLLIRTFSVQGKPSRVGSQALFTIGRGPPHEENTRDFWSCFMPISLGAWVLVQLQYVEAIGHAIASPFQPHVRQRSLLPLRY
jgi:hypothetical protein